MEPDAKQLSRSLERVSRALAEWTVSCLEERESGLEERYGPAWRQRWVEEVEVRLSHLAQAVAVRRPALFVAAARWSRQAFEARGARWQDLAASLECLGEVIAAQLPPPLAEVAGPMVAAAVEHLEDDEPSRSHIDSRAPHARLALEYLEAVLDGQSERAQELVLAAARNGASVTELYDQVLMPAQTEVGRMWHSYEATVADEHHATATTLATMARLRQHLARAPSRGKRMVGAAVSGDRHEVGLRMVVDHFQMAGWEGLYLGADMPVADLVHAIHAQRAQLLALSVTSPLQVRTAGELIEAVRAAPECAGLKILVGGSALNAYPELWREIGADGFATSGAQAVERAEELVPEPAPADS